MQKEWLKHGSGNNDRKARMNSDNSISITNVMV